MDISIYAATPADGDPIRAIGGPFDGGLIRFHGRRTEFIAVTPEIGVEFFMPERMLRLGVPNAVESTYYLVVAILQPRDAAPVPRFVYVWDGLHMNAQTAMMVNRQASR